MQRLISQSQNCIHNSHPISVPNSIFNNFLLLYLSLILLKALTACFVGCEEPCSYVVLRVKETTELQLKWGWKWAPKANTELSKELLSESCFSIMLGS